MEFLTLLAESHIQDAITLVVMGATGIVAFAAAALTAWLTRGWGRKPTRMARR